MGRLMRALFAFGVFTETEPDRFELAPMGRLLRSGVPGSMRARVCSMPVIPGGVYGAI